MNGVLDELELELRRLPGLSGVGFTFDEDLLIIHVATHNDFEDRDRLRHLIAQQARLLVQSPIAIEIDQQSDTGAELATASAISATYPARPGRVRLLDVEIEHHTADVVVRLAHRGRHAVGRGEAGSPSDAARATMRALSALGAELPFRVEASSASGEAVGVDRAVVVLVGPVPDDGQRYGVARGESLEEAACRATLHALNRWLERDDAFAAAS